MKKYLTLIITLLISLISINSFAYTSPPAPANGGYVLDETGKLSQSDIDRLNRKIENLKQNTKNEYGVAIIQSTGGDDIADVGQTIFRTWGIGNKQLNNGVLLVVALAERKTRIQTGKGVEGDLPDLKANDILQQTLKPLLKQGKFYEGVDATLSAISSSMDNRTKAVAQLAEHPSSTAPANDYHNASMLWIWLIVMAVVVGIGVLIYLSVAAAKKREEEWRRESERFDAIERERRRQASMQQNKSTIKHNYIVPVATTAAAAVIISEAEKARRKREADSRRRREEEERASRKRREESSSSSYSSYSSSSYSSGSSFDSGGGFGGGDSGGGGSSGDF